MKEGDTPATLVRSDEYNLVEDICTSLRYNFVVLVQYDQDIQDTQHVVDALRMIDKDTSAVMVRSDQHTDVEDIGTTPLHNFVVLVKYNEKLQVALLVVDAMHIIATTKFVVLVYRIEAYQVALHVVDALRMIP